MGVPCSVMDCPSGRCILVFLLSLGVFIVEWQHGGLLFVLHTHSQLSFMSGLVVYACLASTSERVGVSSLAAVFCP